MYDRGYNRFNGRDPVRNNSIFLIHKMLNIVITHTTCVMCILIKINSYSKYYALKIPLTLSIQLK